MRCGPGEDHRCPCRGRRRPAPGARRRRRCRPSSAAAHRRARLATREARCAGGLGADRGRDVRHRRAAPAPRHAAASPKRTSMRGGRAAACRGARPRRRCRRGLPASAGQAVQRAAVEQVPAESGGDHGRLMVPLPDPLGPSMVTTGTAKMISPSEVPDSPRRRAPAAAIRGRTWRRWRHRRSRWYRRPARLATANAIAIR